MSKALPLVVSDKLTKFFPLPKGKKVHAVDGVDLTIHEREIVGLVGESGSGKTTYGKTLIGLLPKTGGTVKYRGKELPRKYGPADFKHQANDLPRPLFIAEPAHDR